MAQETLHIETGLRSKTGQAAQFILECSTCSKMLEYQDNQYVCANNHLFESRNGIVDLLTKSDEERFQAFIKQYETVRSAEKWGDGSKEYYENLPFIDITGKHTFEWKIKAASYSTLLYQLSAKNVSTVLDVGAGNCWLSYRLCNNGFIGAATDIRVDDYDGLKTPERFWDNIESDWLRVRTSFKHPGFAADQFDAVIFNASLHYSNDPEELIGRFIPLLRKNSALYIVDSPVYHNSASGEQMMKERELDFKERYGIEMSEATQSFYLTFKQIHDIARAFGLQLTIYTPRYGWKWRMRRPIATVLRRREPASFGVFVFEKG